MDQEDLDKWKKVENLYALFVSDKKYGLEYVKERGIYYSYILNKYGVLKNRQIYMDPIKGYIYDLMG